MTPLQGGLNALAAGFKNDSALDDDDDDDMRSRLFETSTVGGRVRSGSGSSNATRKMPDTRGVSPKSLKLNVPDACSRG